MLKDDITKNIADRLKTIRGIRGYTLDKVARKIGVSRKQIQNYETCDCSISLVKLYQLSEVFDVSVNYFLDGIDKRKNILSNEDLTLVSMFHRIKDNDVRKNILQLIKEIGN